MTRIYLDVHDCMRVDTTPDRREAQAAAEKRWLLKMAALLDRMAIVRIQQLTLLNRDATPAIKTLVEICKAKHEIRARL
jgi:hypothetical protein